MRKLLLTTLLLTIGISCFSQGLINYNNTWNVRKCCAPTKTRAYKFEGDTSINSKNYSKLYYSLSEDFNDSKKVFAAYLRQDKQQVFMKTENETESLIYDFGLKVGDSFTFQNDFNHSITLLVDSIDSVEIGGNNKKRLFFKETEPAFNFIPQYWIEDIGSSYGLIEVTSAHVADYSSDLLCVKQMEELIFDSNNGSCYIVSVPIIKEEQPYIKVFPNPSSNLFNIKLTNSNIFNPNKIEVYSLMGSKVFEEVIIDKNNINVEIHKKGIYQLLIIDSKNNLVSSTRVVKL